MPLPRLPSVPLLLVAALATAAPAAGAAPVDPALFQDLQLAPDRPLPRRAGPRGGRRARRARPLLLRRGQRRRVGDARRGTHLEADLRRPAHRLDRCPGRRALRPAGPLRRHRRGGHALRHRRRATASTGPTDGGRDVDARRPRRHAADRPHPRRPRATRTSCSSPPSATPTGPTPSAACSAPATAGGRWKKVLVPRRRHRRHRPRLRARPPPRDLRRAVADAPAALERLPALERSGQRRSSSRPTAATPGAASTATASPRSTAASASAVAPTAPARVYAMVDAERGAASIAPTTAAATGRAPARDDRIWRRGWYFGGVTVDPRRRRRGLRAATRTCTARRTAGRTFVPVQGGSGRRRLPRAVDRPARSEAPDPRHRPGRGGDAERGRDLELLVQPAHGPALPHVHRRPLPLLGVRLAAGLRRGRRCPAARPACDGISCATSARSPQAARATTSRPTRNDPEVIYGGPVDRLDLRTEQTRSVDPTLAEPEVDRSTWTLPLVFSHRDPRVLYFAQPAPLPHRRRRRALDGDQPRPHPRGPRRARQPRSRHRRRHAPGPGRATA